MAALTAYYREDMPAQILTSVAGIDPSPQFPLGTIFRGYDGSKFIYVQFDDGSGNVATATGSPVGWLTPETTPWVVTSDITDTKANKVAGVMVATVTDQAYGFVQTAGYHSAVLMNNDDNVVAGAFIWWIGDATCDGNTNAAGSAAYKPLGVAAAAVNAGANTTATWITCGLGHRYG